MTTDARNHPINCGTPTTNFGGRRFSKAALGGRSYAVLAAAFARQSSGQSAGSVDYKDKNYTFTDNASFVSDYSIQISNIGPTYSFRGTVESDSLSISITPDGNNGYLGTFVSEGTAKLVVEDYQGQKTVEYLPLTQTTGGSAYEFTGYVEGSLAAHLSELFTRLNGLVDIEVFSTRSPSTLTYIRNQACWVNDLDITSNGVWNSAGGFGMGGCLLTRRHMVFTAHYGYHPQVGTQIHFVGRGASAGQPEQVAVRTVSNVYGPGLQQDQTLVRLSEPVPEWIVPAKILPPDFANRLPRDRIGGAILYAPNIKNDGDACHPAVWMGQQSKARLRLIFVGGDGWQQYNSISYQQYFPYAVQGVPGDSGTPVYFVINDEAVYVGNHTGPTAGTSLTRDQDVIPPFSVFPQASPLKQMRDQISAWGDDDVIETVDLSSFPTFS